MFSNAIMHMYDKCSVLTVRIEWHVVHGGWINKNMYMYIVQWTAYNTANKFLFYLDCTFNTNFDSTFVVIHVFGVNLKINKTIYMLNVIIVAIRLENGNFNCFCWFWIYLSVVIDICNVHVFIWNHWNIFLHKQSFIFVWK